MMNWEAIGAIGEVLGALGVIITLAYLASQLRQNTKALRHNAVHAYTAAAYSWSDLVVAHAHEVAEIFQHPASEFDQLSPAQQVMADAMAFRAFTILDSLYQHHSNGAMSSRIFEDKMRGCLDTVFNSDLMMYKWKNLPDNYSISSEFVGYFNERMRTFQPRGSIGLFDGVSAH